MSVISFFTHNYCSRQNNGPLNIFIIGIYEYLILQDKKYIADVIKLNILKLRNYPELFRCV